MESSAEATPPTDSTASIGFPNWESDGLAGWFTAFPSILKSMIVSPGETFEQQNRTSLSFALFYGALINAILFGLRLLYTYFLNPAQLQEIASQSSNPLLTDHMWVFLLIVWVIMPVFTVLLLFVDGGLLQLVLNLFGWSKESYWETTKMTGLSLTSAVVSLVPVVGSILTFLWATVLQVIGLRKVHELSTGKAIVAIVLTLVLFFVAIFAASFVGVIVVQQL